MHKYRITPRPTIEAEKIASDLILHVDDPKTSVPVTAGTIAGLLAGLDQLSEARARVAELEAENERITEAGRVHIRRAAMLEDERDEAANWAAKWLRDNYQEYPNIASLCDALVSDARKPRSLLNLRGSLKRADQQPVPIEAMRIGTCVCGPEGCADSTCPARCGGAA